MSNVCAIDFESFYSKKLKYGLKLMIAEQYCRHELFDCYMVSVCDGKASWSGHPRDFNWSALDDKVIVAHNKYFDYNVWLELARRKLAPAPNFKEFHCTANLTSYLCNRRALDQSVEFLYGVRVAKDARNEADNKRWPKDFTPEQQTKMLEYAKKDAFWCWKIWNDHSDKWPQIERDLSNLTIEQGMKGVQIDVDLLNRYLMQTHEMRANAEAEIPWIKEAEDDSWDEFKVKPTATKCIAEQCRRLTIPCPPVKSDDEEGYQEWEDLYGPKHSWIYAVGAWRSINKLYQTFSVMKERLRDDGTLPFALKYCGAATKRWSGDAKINMQNQRKRPVVCNELGLLERDNKRIDAALDEPTLPSWVRYVIDFRSLIIPRPGKKMIVSDLAQIEPRCLAWLTGNTALLDSLRAGKSLYVAFAQTSMGYEGETMDKSSSEYKLAKAQVLGLGYGCGYEKFIAMAYDLARLDLTENDPEWIEETNPFTNEVKKTSGYGTTSKKIVTAFRAQNPRIVGLWSQLDEGFKRSIGSDFVLGLPNGSKLTYRNVKAVIRIKPDPKTKKPRRTTVFTADVGGRQFEFYGGKLCENLVQATARDVFSEQLVRMDKRGWGVLYHVHDEAVLEVNSDVTAKEVEQEMSHCPEWMDGCPVAAEAKEVERYCK